MRSGLPRIRAGESKMLRKRKVVQIKWQMFECVYVKDNLQINWFYYYATWNLFKLHRNRLQKYRAVNHRSRTESRSMAIRTCFKINWHTCVLTVRSEEWLRVELTGRGAICRDVIEAGICNSGFSTTLREEVKWHFHFCNNTHCFISFWPFVSRLTNVI